MFFQWDDWQKHFIEHAMKKFNLVPWQNRIDLVVEDEVACIRADR